MSIHCLPVIDGVDVETLIEAELREDVSRESQDNGWFADPDTSGDAEYLECLYVV